MLEPSLFENSLDNYPIDWSDAKPLSFIDVQNIDPDSIYYNEKFNINMTNKHVTYQSTEVRTQLVKEFEKIVTNF